MFIVCGGTRRAINKRRKQVSKYWLGRSLAAAVGPAPRNPQSNVECVPNLKRKVTRVGSILFIPPRQAAACTPYPITGSGDTGPAPYSSCTDFRSTVRYTVGISPITACSCPRYSPNAVHATRRDRTSYRPTGTIRSTITDRDRDRSRRCRSQTDAPAGRRGRRTPYSSRTAHGDMCRSRHGLWARHVDLHRRRAGFGPKLPLHTAASRAQLPPQRFGG